MFTSLRVVRARLESVTVTIKPQARRVRHPQQRSCDSSAAVQLAGIADVTGHVYRVFPRGGEARGDVAGRSGRLAPRALG